MLNPNDYKLVPLKELSPELRESYLGFLKTLFDGYGSNAPAEYVHRDLFGVFTIDEIRKGFEKYLSYIHYEGDRENKDNYTGIEICALVNEKSQKVLGEAGFYTWYHRNIPYQVGYDVTHPEFRQQGLGYLLLGMRLKRAKEDRDIMGMILSWDKRNIGSVKRVERLRKAGLIEYEREVPWDTGKMEASINWQHFPETYLKATLTPFSDGNGQVLSGTEPS